MKRCTTLILVALVLCGAPGNTAISQESTEQIVVAPLDNPNSSRLATSRQQLDDQIKRFADRYVTRMSIAIDKVKQMRLTDREYELMQNWQAQTGISAVDIAIGANAVTNLLDMMVLTRLSRLVIENHWVPVVLGEEKGAPLLGAAIALEKDVWTIADAVLTSALQTEMRTMIDNYHRDNSDQIYPWWVRMGQFSGQRAARLNTIKRTGGMLKEVRMARETAEEMQEFAERTLFYLQRVPGIASNSMEASLTEMLGSPQVTQLTDHIDRFVSTTERLVDELAALPDERIAAVDQALQGLDHQRRALFNELANVTPEARQLLVELRGIAEASERTVAMLEQRRTEAEPVDIAEYRAVAADVSDALDSLVLLVDAIGGMSGDTEGISAIVDHLADGQERLINRLLIVMLITVVFFFICLFFYRYIAIRVYGK